MSEDFRLWLSQELERLNWSHSKLARIAGISQSLVSRTLAGNMPASADFCIKISQALDVPPENVLRLAQILPGEPIHVVDSPIALEILRLIHDMPLEQRQEALRYIRYLRQTGTSADNE